MSKCPGVAYAVPDRYFQVFLFQLYADGWDGWDGWDGTDGQGVCGRVRGGLRPPEVEITITRTSVRTAFRS